jgi:uncharacterized membrane protein
MMIAIVFLITYLPFLHIPSPIAQGYFNVGDAAIMITAIILGRKSGFVVGAIGSALADLALGSFIFAPITFIVKGLEGYVTGLIAEKCSKIPYNARKIISLAAGILVMVIGYFVFELTIVRLIDRSLAFTIIAAELPGNLIQGIVSAVMAYVFIIFIDRSNALNKLD